MFGRGKSNLAPKRPITVRWDPNGTPAVNVDMQQLAQSQPAMFKKTQAVKAAFKKTNPKTGRSLAGLRAEVRIYCDYSGSTEWEGRKYYSGKIMQRLVERYVPIGMELDPNGVIEVIPFSSDLHNEIKVGLTANPLREVLDYRDVIDKHVWRGEHTLGGTKYAPILRDLITIAMKSNELIFAVIVTDGDPSDADSTRELVKEASQYGILLKFVGVNNVDYLRELDDMEKRHPGSRLFDNVDTQIFDGDELPTIFDVSDEQFAEAMAEEIQTSLLAAHDAGVIQLVA